MFLMITLTLVFPITQLVRVVPCEAGDHRNARTMYAGHRDRLFEPSFTFDCSSFRDNLYTASGAIQGLALPCFLLGCLVSGEWTAGKSYALFLLSFTNKTHFAYFASLVARNSNLAMNSGKKPFAAHWLFWQNFAPLFNENNPSGTICYSRVNYTINAIAVILGFIVALKRLWWGMYLGVRSYSKFLI